MCKKNENVQKVRIFLTYTLFLLVVVVKKNKNTFINLCNITSLEKINLFSWEIILTYFQNVCIMIIYSYGNKINVRGKKVKMK